MFDQGPSGGEPVGSPVSARIAAAPTADRPAIEVAKLGELAARPARPVIRVSVSASLTLVVVPVGQQQRDPFQRAAPMRDHAGRVGEGGEQRCATIRSDGFCPPRWAI